MAYPIFSGGDPKEDALEFCDQFELASLSRGKEEEMVRIFPYTLRSRARVWFNSLETRLKQEWSILKANFLARFEVRESSQGLLEALQQLQ